MGAETATRLPAAQTPLAIVALAAIAVVACHSPRSEPEAPLAAKSPSAPLVAAEQEPPSAELELPVERARLEKDVAWLAKVRTPGSRHHLRVRRVLGERLEQLGFALERHEYGSGVNVIGRRAGKLANAEQVIVSAHYDHIAGCAGADDNASGVASALEIARVIGKQRREHTLVIAFWDEEERGLVGSRAFARRARDRGERIRIMISLDAIGVASSEPGSQRVPQGFESALPEHAAALAERRYAGDFVALVANTDATRAVNVFTAQARATSLPVLSLVLSPLQWLAFPDVFRSDHASFWQNGYPALLLSDTGDFRNPGYHCARRPDTARTLDYAFVARVTEATALSAAELTGPG